MRLDEITKTEFVDNLTDPAMAELKKINKEIKNLARIDKLTYSLKTYNHPDLGTRRKAEIFWDFRYVPQAGIPHLNQIEAYIGSFYKNNLQNWTLKGWDAMSNTQTVTLIEK